MTCDDFQPVLILAIHVDVGEIEKALGKFRIDHGMGKICKFYSWIVDGEPCDEVYGIRIKLKEYPIVQKFLFSDSLLPNAIPEACTKMTALCDYLRNCEIDFCGPSVQLAIY